MITIRGSSVRWYDSWCILRNLHSMLCRLDVYIYVQPGYVYRWDPELDTDLDDREHNEN